MPMNLLSADDFRAAAKDGGQADGMIFRFSTGDAQEVEGAARTKRFVFSDATVDHSKDSIDPKGWGLSIFNKNPVALFSHMSWEPPIGRASNVSVINDQLVGDIEFASAEVYPLADTIFRLVDAGFLRAVSVGFMPKEWAWSTDKERPYGINFTKQELLEISCCSIPANPSALIEARSMGINTAPLMDWAEKVLDSGDTVFLPRKDLEALRSQAKSGSEPRFYIQATKAISADAAKRVRDVVKAWAKNPDEVLVLDQGLTLRTVGDDSAPDNALSPPDEVVPPSEVDANVQNKAGRKLSAATKTALGKALDHLEQMGKCIKDLMDDDAEEEPGDEDDDQVIELAAPPVEVPINLTPEERRLKEARELRATLPPIG